MSRPQHTGGGARDAFTWLEVTESGRDSSNQRDDDRNGSGRNERYFPTLVLAWRWMHLYLHSAVRVFVGTFSGVFAISGSLEKNRDL